jgi:anti-anti-sigma factor
MLMADTPVKATRVPLVEVVITEALDAQTASQVTAALAEALRIHPVHLAVDLAACQAIDAAGIAVLLEAHRRARRDGGHLTLRSPSERVRRNLRLARIDNVLHMVPSNPMTANLTMGTTPDS